MISKVNYFFKTPSEFIININLFALAEYIIKATSNHGGAQFRATTSTIGKLIFS
jgi:hypothetical protein